jgi:hypothetical protein
MESFNNSVDRHFVRLSAAYAVLAKIQFPNLVRPTVAYKAAPTTQLVEWCIRVYCFSLTSQYRDLLRSLLLLVGAKHVPGVSVVARSLYELGAHCYYTKKHVNQYLDAGDTAPFSKFMAEINTGSRFMRESGDDQSLESPHISKVIKCFNEYMKDEEWPKAASTSHSFLSEITHPNCFAFIRHFDFVEKPEGVTVVFEPPSRDLLASILPDVTIANMSVFHNGSELLRRAGEREIAGQLWDGIDALLMLQ